MRKILSILLALGLVLSMSVVAAPVTADDCEATVVLSNDCATATSGYNVTFESPYTILPGNDAFVFEFPEGTTFGTVVAATSNYGPATVTKAGLLVTVKLGTQVPAGETVWINITGVKNPAASGEYTLNLWVDMLCCELEQFDCAEYTIKPAKSTYKFVLDFGTTYPDIAEDFVPPFKATGQEGFGWYDADDDYWFTEFDIWLMPDVEGCAGYDPVIINFWLEDAPAGSTVSLYLYGYNGTPGDPDVTLDFHLFELTLDDEDPWQWGFAPDGFPLAADHNEATPARIHFDTVGDYEICFELEYLGVEDDCSPIEGGILAEMCVEGKVYQDKEAWQLEFNPKWNLISLPLVPFETDVDAILAAMNEDGLSQLKSIYYYDRCVDDWFVWGNGQTSLTDIEDGKAYWVRMLKATETGFDPTITPTLWVWGTHRPMPPAGPPAYPVCEGPNMVGFLPPWNLTLAPPAPQTQLAADYLFNFYSFLGQQEYGMIYGWDGLNWVTQSEPGATLVPTEGYWIVFERDGTIYP